MAKKIVILFCFISFFYSCSNSKLNSQPVYKNSFLVAGTYLEVLSSHKDAAGIVYDEFRRLEKILNSYDPDSEISQLNNIYNIPYKVSSDLIDIIEISIDIDNQTDGIFDISCGVLYEFWKSFIKDESVITFPNKAKIDEMLSLCGNEYVEVRPDDETITIAKKGLKIDLGGIAKGFMVDKAVFKLKQRGINHVLINAGGDIYCLNEDGKNPWSIGIKNPNFKEETVSQYNLVDKAVATSGGYEQFFTYKDKRYSHLIDSSTGYPVQNNILSISVISNKCALSDALATAFFAMGIDKIKQFIERSKIFIKVIVIVQAKEGQQVYTFEQR